METPLLTIAVSSRALFNFEEENRVFENQGEGAYMQEQRGRMDTVAATGVAYPMVKKLLAFNSAAAGAGATSSAAANTQDGATENSRLVDVIVISRNDPTTGLRVFRAVNEYGLDIRRGCFTRGNPSLPYLQAFGAHLFLSAFEEDVRAALARGFPAARVLGSSAGEADSDDVLRIAFDGDAVLFGDDSERVYQEKGLEEFQSQEKTYAQHPLPAGPMKPFLEALLHLRERLPPNKIRTALITARGAPAHERPIRTLMQWGVEVDEAFFLSGAQKKDVLAGFKPDFFFDDQLRHLPETQAGGHVSAGVMNEPAGGQ